MWNVKRGGAMKAEPSAVNAVPKMMGRGQSQTGEHNQSGR